MSRKSISEKIQTEVLTKSKRRCAFCFGLDGDFSTKKGQIAHIDQDSSNATLDNLVFLCLPHHDEYDSKSSQSKGLTPGELKSYRTDLYARVEAVHARDEPSDLEHQIRTLRQRFLRSVEDHLAADKLIPRAETNDVLSSLDDDNVRLVMVHGPAGVGKSGVLFELVTRLEDVPCLPLRLDHQTPVGSPLRLGESLDLPHTPAHSLHRLAQGQRAVLVLDQLDALRWTSAHSAEAWDVCQEVIDEALHETPSLKVVVCCRTFDLEHDPQIRGWIQSLKNLRKIQVGPLSEESVDSTVRAVLQKGAEGEEAEGGPTIRPNERELLRHVIHLTMWAEIVRSSRDFPRFASARALVDRFWATRFDDLEERGIDRARAETILEKLVEHMDGGTVLAAPLRKLSASQAERHALTSLHILQISGDAAGGVTFCHQSYLDHLVVNRLLGQIEEGEGDLLTWLGPKERQSLFRREQLRLVLDAVREEMRGRYLPSLRQLLGSEGDVRFHLRLLVLQFLGQVPQPRPDEIDFVAELLADDAWRSHVLLHTIGSVPWFEALADHGLIAPWLASEDEELRDGALNLLRRFAEGSGDRVARLLEPYEGRDDDWPRRCAFVLSIRPERDSQALFAMRCRLVEKGVSDCEYFNWKTIAEADFGRFVLLARDRLSFFIQQALKSRDGYRIRSSHGWDWDHLDEFNPSSVCDIDLLAAGWQSLTETLWMLLRAARNERMGLQGALEPSALDLDDVQSLLQCLRELAAELLRRDWRSFVSQLEARKAQSSLVAETLVLDALAGGPACADFADWALEWLMSEPPRLRLRYRRHDGPWDLSGDVVARFGSLCSDDCFARFENFVLEFQEPDLLERYRYRHESIQEQSDWDPLTYPSSSGATAYYLLPQLSSNRRSFKAERRICELERKFGSVDSVFFSGWGIGQCGVVGASIDRNEVLNRLSDRSWLKIIKSGKLRQGRGRRIYREGRFEENSVEAYAGALRGATRSEPERFARLALQVPEEAPPDYRRAILGGLDGKEPPGGLPADRRETWQPATHEAIEAVLALPQIRNDAMSDSQTGRDICWLLWHHSKHSWSLDVLQMLVMLATEHHDPEPHYFPVQGDQMTPSSSEGLYNNAINCTRGTAGFAVASLLFAEPARIDRLRSAITQLVRDPHPAVRVGAIEACVPVLHIDRELAISWFLEACEGHDPLLATSPARRFLWDTVCRETNQLEPLLARMMESDFESVARDGAFYVAACFLLENLLEDRYHACVEGSVPHRQGVVDAALDLLKDPKHVAAGKEVLVRFLDDGDEAVHSVASRAIDPHGMKESALRLDDPFVVAFARSRAYQAEPSMLLRVLMNQPGSLLPYAQVVLTAVRTYAEELAGVSRDPASRRFGDAHYLAPLLLRLYEASEHEIPDVYQGCLDLWDLLLERRAGAAFELTHELDRL